MSVFNAGTVQADIEIDRGKLQASVSDAVGEFRRLGQEGEQEGQRAGSRTGEALGAGLGMSLESAMDTAKEKLKSSLQSMASGGAPAGKLIGAGVGLALVGSLVTAMNFEPAKAKLTAQLGLTGPESARLGGVAGKLFAANYGEGFEDVTAAIRSVVQNIGGMATASSADLQSVTGQVMSLASAFDQDLGAVTRAVGQMMKTGMAANATEALDIITVGFQNGADKAEDFLDTLNEYGTQFRKLGIDGADATGLITQGLKAGARDADIVADAFKEFAIRAIDGSELTRTSFQALGLDAQKMQADVAAGGERAAAATDLVLDSLRNVADPAERAAIAVGLFGTQSEDLGEALFALDLTTAAEGLGKIEGAAAEVDRVMSDTAQGGLSSIVRGIQVLADQVGSALLPILKPLIASLAGLGEAIGSALGFVLDLPGPLIAAAAALAGWAIISSLAPMLVAFGGALTAAAVAVRGFLAAMGPVGLILTGVTVALSFFMDQGSGVEETIEAQASRWERLAATVDAATGKVTEATRVQIASEAQQSGMLKTIQDLGISTELYVDASVGAAGAAGKLGQEIEKTAGGILSQSEAYRALAPEIERGAFTQREFTDALSESNPEEAAAKMGALQDKVNAYAMDQERATGVQGTATEIQARFAAAVAEGQAPLAALGGILNMASTDAAGFSDAAKAAAEIAGAVGSEAEGAVAPVDGLRAALGGAAEAADPLTEALKGAADATTELDNVTKFLQITLDEAAGGIISSETSYRAFEAAKRDLSAATRDQAQANDDERAAAEAVTAAISEFGEGSKEATQAQRDYEAATDDAKAATDDMFDAGKQAADQAIRYAGTLLTNGRANGTLKQATQQATAAVADARNAFIAAQPEADRLSGKADKTADALFGIPKDTVAKINEQGAANVKSQADGVTARVNAIPGSKTSTLGAVDMASGTLANISNLIAGIPSSKTVTVNVGANIAAAAQSVINNLMENGGIQYADGGVHAADGLMLGRGLSTVLDGKGGGVTWAEEATGKEYYLSMKAGMEDRNRGLLMQAASDLGMVRSQLEAPQAGSPQAAPVAQQAARSAPRAISFGVVNVGRFDDADRMFDRAMWEVMG